MGGVDELVAGILGQAQAHPRVGGVARLGQDRERGAGGHVFDADDLVAVGQPAFEPVEEALAEVNFTTGADFRVKGAVEIRGLPENLEAKREFTLEKPRLLESEDNLAGPRADLEAQAELLAGALEEGAPVEQVEVRLRDLGEDHRPLERAEARAEGQVARAGLLDGNLQVAAAGDVGGLVRHVDRILEEAGVLEAQLADLHQHRAENIARPERELAQDHDALGLVVALDLDGLDLEFFALGDLELDVDVAGLEVGFADEADARLQVTITAVEFLQGLRILVQFRGDKNLSLPLPRDQAQESRRIELVTRETDVTELVLAPLADADRDEQPVGLRVVEGDFVLGDLDVEVAHFLVVIAQLAQIGVKFVVFEPPAAGEPGEDVPLLGLNLLAQLLGLDVVVADKIDGGDAHLGALAHLESHPAETGAPVAIHTEGDLRLVVAVFLVEFVELLGVVLDLAFVQRTVGHALDFLQEAFLLVDLVALEMDAEDAEFGGQFEHEAHGVARQRLTLDLNKLEQTRLVERADVAVDQRLVEVGVLAQGHVGPHDLLAHIGHAHEFDRDGADVLEGGGHWPLLRWRRRLVCGSLRPQTRGGGQQEK